MVSAKLYKNMTTAQLVISYDYDRAQYFDLLRPTLPAPAADPGQDAMGKGTDSGPSGQGAEEAGQGAEAVQKDPDAVGRAAPAFADSRTERLEADEFQKMTTKAPKKSKQKFSGKVSHRA